MTARARTWPAATSAALALWAATGSAWAHGDFGGVIAFAFGASAGLVAAVVGAVIASARPGARGRKTAAIVAMLLGLPVLGGALGAFIQDAPRQRRNAEYLDNENRYQRSAVRSAVCDHDLPSLRREFAKPAAAAEPWILARALADCTFNGDEPARRATFASGMLLLAEAPGRDRSTVAGRPSGYCSLLAWVHYAQRAPMLVRELKGLGLPLTCRDERGEPMWWRGLERERGELAWQWLQTLRESRVDFAERAERTGETVLDRVVRCHEPRVVRLVLEAAPAIDVRAVSGPSGQRPPTAWWAVRRFEHRNSTCRINPSAPEQSADIVAIDARMGELTPDMVNQMVPRDDQRRQFRDGTLLWHVGPTPQAELLSLLLTKGADVQARNQRGESFLYDVADPDADFLAVLARLPDEQIRRLAEPAPGANGNASEALAVIARKRQHTRLVEFLCKRSARGC